MSYDSAQARASEAGGRRPAISPVAAQPDAGAFEDGLTGFMPNLKAFARSLTSDAARADDLVQETMAKALTHRDKFQAGTNQRAWLFAILRNTFLSDIRRSKREVDFDEAPEPRTGGGLTAQEAAFRLSELAASIEALPKAQRQAILLVGAAGLSYEEAAEICDCAVGTVKSRVSRARSRLEAQFSNAAAAD